MPKAVHLSIPAAPIFSRKSAVPHAPLNRSVASRPAQFARKPSWVSELIPVALFSCVGLLTSLIVLLIGQQGLWY